MSSWSTDAEVLSRYERDVSVVRATPDAVVRPTSVQEIVDAVSTCVAQRLPLLPVGARTSTTGASVPVGGGVVMDLTALGADAQVDEAAGTIVCAPGAVLADVHRLARQHGFDMPVDPTSSPDCTVGGAVATNASGPSSFRHGAMVDWVQEVAFVDGAGRRRRLVAPQVPKRAMGPAALQSPPAWFVGSEGTLGVLTEVTLRLRQAPRAAMTVVVGFPSRALLMEGVRALRRARVALPTLRAVEWLDAACCRLVAPHAEGLKVPEGQGGALIVEVEEQQDGGSCEQAIEQVVELLAPFEPALDQAQMIVDSRQQHALDHLRHMVPDSLNRQGRAFAQAHGGGKLSTDWSVPLERMESLLCWTDQLFADVPLDGLYMYGHIGDGHPHLNLLCPNADVRSVAFARLKEQLARVVELGGVPVSEHGVGKLKRDVVKPFLPAGAEAAWRGLKAEFDPYEIMAPGNVF